LKRASNAIMSRKDFLHGFCALKALAKWEKCELTIVRKEGFLNYIVKHVSFKHAAELVLKIHVFPDKRMQNQCRLV